MLEAYLARARRAGSALARATGFAPVRAAWLARGFGLGERDPACASTGRAARPLRSTSTDDGALLLEQAGGRRREIAAGDVFYLDR